jgi:hypothetical protein
MEVRLMTKNEMARVIAQALFRMDDLPPADNWKVVGLAKWRKDDLQDQYDLALKVMETRNG